MRRMLLVATSALALTIPAYQAAADSPDTDQAGGSFGGDAAATADADMDVNDDDITDAEGAVNATDDDDSGIVTDADADLDADLDVDADDIADPDRDVEADDDSGLVTDDDADLEVDDDDITDPDRDVNAEDGDDDEDREGVDTRPGVQPAVELEADDLVGVTVASADGVFLGTIEEVIVGADQRPESVVVVLSGDLVGVEGERRTVPAHQLEVDAAEGAASLDMTRSTFEGLDP